MAASPHTGPKEFDTQALCSATIVPLRRCISVFLYSGTNRGLMRTLVQPPPSTRCSQCTGELRLKRLEPDDRYTEAMKEIFVCANCGYQLSCVVAPDKYAGHTHLKPQHLR
jgi:hypothetical protein